MFKRKYSNDRGFAIDESANNRKHKSRSKLGSFLFFLVLGIIVAVAVCFSVFLVGVSKTLPTSDEILVHEPNLTTIVYDRNSQEITKLFQENRNWVKLGDISPWMVKAILAAEDSKFYEHSGIRPIAVLRAAVFDFFHLGAKQGGSTITQQLARNLFLTKEKTLIRKIKEAVLALRIEKVYSKDQILEIYLNTIYMGHGAYGVESAAQTYFGKRASALTIAESATLSGLVAAPEKYSPVRNENNSMARRVYVLKRMLDLDWISKEDYDSALQSKLKITYRAVKSGGLNIKDAPYFISFILFKHLLPTYGTDAVYRGGLRVYTTIDMDLQKKAEELVSKMPNEGALIALDPNTGEILAMVGGRNFDKSKFNRATQAYRQPGSAFKPLVYTAALDSGYRSIDHILDAPLLFDNGWAPSNYENRFSGEITFMTAIAKSINTSAVRLAQITGIKNVIDVSSRMGIPENRIPNDLSASLGTASITPLDLCVAYSCFANNGYRVTPYGIREIDSSSGEALEQNGPKLQEAINVTTAVTARSLLQQVMLYGTGSGARIEDYESFGKTGTTNDWTDAWFAGGVPGLVVVVYTGNDDHKPLGGKRTGAVAAAPIWKSFVSYAVKKLNLEKRFAIPPDASVEAVTVCTQTGFLAAPGCKTTNILLPVGQVPSSQCPWHGGSVIEARSDENAPQLLLAQIDDDTQPGFANNADNEIQQTTAAQDPQASTATSKTTADTQPKVAVKKEKHKLWSRSNLPESSKNNSYYKNADSEESKKIEAQFQELLKQYNLK